MLDSLSAFGRRIIFGRLVRFKRWGSGLNKVYEQFTPEVEIEEAAARVYFKDLLLRRPDALEDIQQAVDTFRKLHLNGQYNVIDQLQAILDKVKDEMGSLDQQ